MPSEWKTTVQTVTTTAVIIGVPQTRRMSLSLHNNGAANIFLGPSTVTADATADTGGWILAPGEKVHYVSEGGYNGSTEDLYARCASGTVEMRVMERNA